ncbi:hypothetical protein [Wolbachia pipientis]|uniref:hypothetical protein n=1 Tax=Wolbachia pipientis TaxID=955 RepID=UPI0025A4A134|nr:hypothetical protein [Wolbachia pipientis]MDM8335434.1 hypothetical protein [Wolbachia pipientis]
MLVAASSFDGSVGDISTTTSDNATSANIDDEKEQASDQSAEPESKDGQQNSPLSQIFESNSSLSLVNVPTKGKVDTDSSNGEYVKVSLVLSNGSSVEDIDKSGIVPTSESSSLQDTKPKILEQTSDTQTNCMQPDNQSNMDDYIDDYGLLRFFLKRDDRDSHPENTFSS